MERTKKMKIVNIFVFAFLLSLTILISCGCTKKSPQKPTQDAAIYSITYAGLEGAINPNSITEYTSNSGKIALQDPERDGYPFEGWTLNGENVTEIDGDWGQDVTLVANWGEHYCHIEFEWDLPEEYRFYFLNEPYKTGFYVEGKWVELAPKVWLMFGDGGKVYIPYMNGISLRMEGFDSKTVGIKTVTISVRNIYSPDGEELRATKSFEVEVRDYDHDYYGYISQPENVYVDYPCGYSFSAKVKHEEAVMSYNWMDSLAYSDPEMHAESCSEQNYNPYTFLHGSSALTDTLIVPSAFNTSDESYKLLTVYDDFTRVYSNEVTAYVETATSEELENYARLGEFVFGTDETRGGKPFDLKENQIGSGTISFVKTENGAEFTFTNVHFVNDDYVCDAFNSSVGFEYFYVKGINQTGENTEAGEYFIHLVGDNYLVNTYLEGGASGINLNFQNPRQIERIGIINYGTLTIDGEGSLNLVGGSPAIYANSFLKIKSKLVLSPYMGRNSSGIEANDIELCDGAKLNAMSKGTALTSMLGNVVIEEGAEADLNLVIPRKEGLAAGITAIQAGNDVRFMSKRINISVSATPEIYEIYDNQKEGVDKCILVSAERAVVLSDGANVNMKVIASNSQNLIPVFGMIYGLSGGSGQENGVYIEDSTLNIDLQADLFYGVYAIAADSTIEILNSVVDVRMKCKNNINGIYCENGNIAVINSEVSVYGRSSLVHEAPVFGVFAGPNSSIEVINSLLDVDMNRGLAVAGYFAWSGSYADYDAEYNPKPKLLDGFTLGENQQYGLYSVFAVDDNDNRGFHVLETIYDVSLERIVPATKVHADTRQPQ